MIPRTKSSVFLVSVTESPIVGSSRMTSSASKWRARAIATPWRSPPDIDADERLRRDRLRGEAQELEHQLLGLGPHAAHVEQAEPSRPLAAHEDVPPERLLVGERALLVDGLDPELAGTLDRQVADVLSLPG